MTPVDPVIAVSKAAADRADHRPYIEAVCQALDGCGFRVSEATVTESEAPLRLARLVLCPVAETFATVVPETASASWDESGGWQLIVNHEDLVSQFAEGTNVLLTPRAVAAWAVIALTGPAVATENFNPQRRDPAVSDPEFEDQLTAYSGGERPTLLPITHIG
jgi:hypothetical protein